MRQLHGLSGTPEWSVWFGMMRRCNEPSHRSYPAYGGRGITVCERWLTFVNFYEDMPRRPSSDHSLDRVDNALGYAPGNVRWATPVEQARNTRRNRRIEHNGENLTISQWTERLGLGATTITMRLQKGWTTAQVLAPRHPQGRRKKE